MDFGFLVRRGYVSSFASSTGAAVTDSDPVECPTTRHSWSSIVDRYFGSARFFGSDEDRATVVRRLAELGAAEITYLIDFGVVLESLRYLDETSPAQRRRHPRNQRSGMSTKLAVVIPFYNVERYMAQCLRSVAGQDFTDLDVVLVDDGSTDGSALIAQQFVDQDPRFRLVRQPNRGPGAARNNGIRQISPDADHIAFVDSDDVLPSTAYSSLLASLEASGSDIVAGNVYRMASAGSFQSEKHAIDFRRARTRTDIYHVPGLLMDRTVWNKIYRRTFWDRHGIKFPEGMLYEDSPVTIPLYYLARGVDIVPETVYYWRIRENGNPSITQQRTISSMVDRLTSIDLVRTILKNRVATSRCLDLYDQNMLTEEIPSFFEDLLGADGDYPSEFAKRAAAILDQVTPALIAAVPPKLRDVYTAVVADRRPEPASMMRAARIWEESSPVTTLAGTGQTATPGSVRT